MKTEQAVSQLVVQLGWTQVWIGVLLLAGLQFVVAQDGLLNGFHVCSRVWGISRVKYWQTLAGGSYFATGVGGGAGGRGANQKRDCGDMQAKPRRRPPKGLSELEGERPPAL